MILGIFDGFTVLKDLIVPIIDFIGNGIKNLVDFIINIPSLYNSLIKVIPDPLYTVLFSFIGLLIVIIVIKVVK